MEDCRGRIEADRPARADIGIVPAKTFHPVDRHHVVRKDGTETRIGKCHVTVGQAHRAGMRLPTEFDGWKVGHAQSDPKFIQQTRLDPKQGQAQERVKLRL